MLNVLTVLVISVPTGLTAVDLARLCRDEAVMYPPGLHTSQEEAVKPRFFDCGSPPQRKREFKTI